jgi:phenylacetate-CoA ligase
MLRCFPYSLNLVAKYILANHLDCLTVKGIITTGELLYDHQRNCLEKAFSCKVFNSYGSRETGLIAQECNQHDGLHMNMESLFIEFLDSSGAPVREGELGQIVVTDLLNFGMPLIRYQIDDFGTFSTRTCRCGRSLPLMEDIRGRVVDEIIVPDGRKVSASTLVLYLVDNGPPVGQVQIVQEELDHFRILLTKDPLPDERVFTYYESTAKRLLGDSVRISFDLVDGIPKEPSGKYRFVKSRIKH